MVYMFFIWLKIALYGLTLGRLIFVDVEPVPKMWGGICIATIVTSMFNLFLPVDKSFQIAFDIFIFVLAILQFKKLRSDFSEMFSFLKIENNVPIFMFVAVVCLIVLFANSARSTLNDMGFYYIQNIKWIQEFPIVPGLGNLFTRLANNSNWFVASALFNPKWLVPAYPLNGFLFFSTVVYLLKLRYDTVLDIDRRTRTIFFFLAIGASITLYQWKVEAPNTDVAVTLILWILAGLFVQVQREVLRTSSMKALIGLLALFIPAIKLNYLPVIFIPVYLAWKEIKQNNWQLVRVLLVFGLLIYIPWCIRSVILSGYLVFPFYQIDFFNFDWKMPKEILVHETELIKWWARVPNIDTAISSKMTISEWLPVWIMNLSIINKSLLVTTVVGTLLYLKDLIIKKLCHAEEILVLFFVCLCGIILCIVGAPDLRFCYGFMVLINAIVYNDLITVKLLHGKIENVIIYVAIIFIILTGIIISRTSDTGFFVPCHRYPSSLRVKEIDGIKIHMAQSPGEMGGISPDDSSWVKWWKQNHRGIYEDRLWDAGLPASPYLRKGLTMRGTSLKDGFKIVGQ